MKHISAISIILIIAFSCGTVPATAKISEGVNLAQLEAWNIVVAEYPIAAEVYAAEELQELFRQASGVKLPIVRKINRLGRHVLSALAR